jgi:hypothetical protein
MPQKKSHRVASRQAATSKERKKKKKAQATQQRVRVAPATPELVDASPPEPVATSIAQPAQETEPARQYTGRDLRKIGIIAGSMIIILIVLGFVL